MVLIFPSLQLLLKILNLALQLLFLPVFGDNVRFRGGASTLLLLEISQVLCDQIDDNLTFASSFQYLLLVEVLEAMDGR